MKLAFSVLIDVDDTAAARDNRGDVRDQLAEDIRGRLTAVLDDLPVAADEVRVWSRTAPGRRKPMRVESIHPVTHGRYRVSVRVDDDRTTSRTFTTKRAAEAWADKVDPLPLPDDPAV